jgi:sugar diacid utilization regulator
MPTLSILCSEPALSLRFADGSRQAADRAVDAIRVLPGTGWSRSQLGDVSDALVVITLSQDAGQRPPSAAVDQLLRELARQRAAGLALAVDRHGAVPVDVRSSAARLNLPLLTTTTPLSVWSDLTPRLHEYRYQRTEWHIEQLTALLNRLPAQLADPDAMQRVADWLAAALDAEVLVSDSCRGILAASPETAVHTLAPFLVRQAVQSEHAAPARDRSLHTRLVSLVSEGTDAVLSVASRRPFDGLGTELMQHAAKVLGWGDQARQEHQMVRVADAVRGVRLGAFQLLMVGDEVSAQRVMAGLAPGLLTTDRVRVYVIDNGGRDREAAARHCESAVSGRAMLVRCPAFDGHLIVVDPLHDEDDDPRSVANGLRQVVASLPELRMGGSLVHPLSDVSAAYAEALTALVMARQMPGRVGLSEERAQLADILEPALARRWAGTFLRPVLTLPTGQRDQLLRTLSLGLEFQHITAGRIIGIHRNTVAHRIAKVGELLNLDLDRVLDRVVVSLAVQIVLKHGHEEISPDPMADLQRMLSAPEVRAWAETFLKPLKGDRRDLLRTLRAWLEHDSHVEKTAAALDLSPVTVRSHLRAAEPLIQRELILSDLTDDVPDQDEHVLSGVRPLAFALHVSTSHPSGLVICRP